MFEMLRLQYLLLRELTPPIYPEDNNLPFKKEPNVAIVAVEGVSVAVAQSQAILALGLCSE